MGGGGGGGAAFDKKIASQCSIQFSKYIWHLGSTFTNLITLGIGNPFQKTKSPTHPMPGWLVGLWVIPYSSNKKPWAYTVNFIYIYIRWGLCASQFQPWASPPPGIWKKKLNARPCGQVLLANAWPPIPSVVVKCLALQSIWSIYKIISCHILINISVSTQ